MNPVVLSGRVLWAPGFLAIIQIGNGQIILPRGDLDEGDLVQLVLKDGFDFQAYTEQNGVTWIQLSGEYGVSAFTAPRGTCLSPRISIEISKVAMEISEGFDLDPELDDQTVPAAGLDYFLELPITIALPLPQ